MNGFYYAVYYITSCGVEGGMGMKFERGISERLRAFCLCKSNFYS